MEYLFVVCGAFSALFSLLLFTRKHKSMEHWLLGLMFLLITVNCLYVFSFSKSTSPYYSVLFSELNYAIPLLYGPLLWFFSKAMTIKNYKLQQWDYLHFLPFLLFLIIILIPAYSTYSLPADSQLGYPIIKLVTAPFYLFAVIKIIREYHKKFLEQYSYEQEVNLLWMNWIVTGAVILWAIGSASYIYNLFNENDKILLYDFYTLSFLGLYLFGLAFVAVRYTDMFSIGKSGLQTAPAKFELAPIENADLDPQTEDYESQDEKLLRKIMEEDEPYLDPLLTLSKLSTLTRIPAYRLTKVLKNQLNSSFYDFVNTYRVNKVKALLAEGRAEQLSMLGIAEESGFNSKASFNRIFKKLTSVTPTDYLRSLDSNQIL